MSADQTFRARTVHLLGMAGLGRNVGYGANKVFTGPMLQNLQISQPLIGVILGLEGLLGLIMNPTAGWLSDHTTKPGFRRKIYVGICLPGAALAWLLFYFLHRPAPAMIVIVIFYLFQQASMSPYQAWMPEIVPSTKWGVASGYLNLWWLVGNLTAFLVIPLVLIAGIVLLLSTTLSVSKHRQLLISLPDLMPQNQVSKKHCTFVSNYYNLDYAAQTTGIVPLRQSEREIFRETNYNLELI